MNGRQARAVRRAVKVQARELLASRAITDVAVGVSTHKLHDELLDALGRMNPEEKAKTRVDMVALATNAIKTIETIDAG